MSWVVLGLVAFDEIWDDAAIVLRLFHFCLEQADVETGVSYNYGDCFAMGCGDSCF